MDLVSQGEKLMKDVKEKKRKGVVKMGVRLKSKNTGETVEALISRGVGTDKELVLSQDEIVKTQLPTPRELLPPPITSPKGRNRITREANPLSTSNDFKGKNTSKKIINVKNDVPKRLESGAGNKISKRISLLPPTLEERVDEMTKKIDVMQKRVIKSANGKKLSEYSKDREVFNTLKKSVEETIKRVRKDNVFRKKKWFEKGNGDASDWSGMYEGEYSGYESEDEEIYDEDRGMGIQINQKTRLMGFNLGLEMDIPLDPTFFRIPNEHDNSMTITGEVQPLYQDLPWHSNNCSKFP